MASQSAIVPLGLGGIAAVFLLSGIQGKSLGSIFEGDFGEAPNPAEGSQPVKESGGGSEVTPSPGEPTKASSSGLPGDIAKGPVYAPTCRIGSPFPCGPGAATLLSLANIAQSKFGLVITATTNGVHAPQSYHYYGRAFDAAASGGRTHNSDAFAEYVRKNYGTKVLELFYMPLRIAIKNGQSIPWASSGETCTSCIHVAM